MSFDVACGHRSGWGAKRRLPRLRGLVMPSLVICSCPVSVDSVGTRTFATLVGPVAWLAAVALLAAPLHAAAPAADASSATDAGDPPAGDPDDATARFDRAEAMYREGRYEEAIEILEGLIADYPEPILYFNLGRAHESSGRIEDAIAAYEGYLDADPDAPDRDSVRERIVRLQERLSEERTEPAPPRPVPAMPPPPRPIVAPWVVAGVGGAGLAVGVTFAGLSRARSNDARDAPDQITAKSEHDTARRHALAANVAFGVGGALLLAGVIWGIAAVVKRRRSRSSSPTARAWLQPRGLGRP